jgi:hypothetical protein
LNYESKRDNDGNFCINFKQFPQYKFRYIRWKLCRKFGLKKIGVETRGLNERFQTFSSSEGKLSIEWDIWSGLIVRSKEQSAEPMVLNIAGFLSRNGNSEK